MLETVLQHTSLSTDLMQGGVRTAARCILRWLQQPDEFVVELRLLGELRCDFDFNGWRKMPLPCNAASVVAHQSGIAADEFLHRTFSSTVLQRRLTTAETGDQLLRNAETVTLAMSLHTRKPFSIDDIAVKGEVWAEAPNAPFSFPRRWGVWRGSPVSANTAAFLSRLNPGAFEDSIDNNAIERWLSLLNHAEHRVHAFRRINNAVLEALGASDLPEYSRENVTRDALSNLFCGMETILGGSGKEDRPTKRFVAGWRQLLAHDPKIVNPNVAAKRLYRLRSCLVHGNQASLLQALREAKSSLGDWCNPGSYDINSFTWNLSQTLTNAWSRIEADPTLLVEAEKRANEVESHKTSFRWLSLLLHAFSRILKRG